MTDVSTAVATLDDEVTAPANDVAALIQSFNTPGSAVYSSIQADSFDERLRVVSALSTSESLSDHLGEIINLVHFVAQPVTITDPTTGETNEAARVILIDEDGSAYYAVSLGIATALRNIVAVAGEPAGWDHPISVYAAEEKTRRGFRVLTLKLNMTAADTTAAAKSK